MADYPDYDDLLILWRKAKAQLEKERKQFAEARAQIAAKDAALLRCREWMLSKAEVFPSYFHVEMIDAALAAKETDDEI